MAKSKKKNKSARSGASRTSTGSDPKKKAPSNKSQTKSGAKSKSNSKSRKSLGLTHRRPASRSSLASNYRAEGGHFTACGLEQGLFDETILRQLKASDFIVNYGASLHDTVLMLALCPTHQKIALTKLEDRGLFLPCTGHKNGGAWVDSLGKLTEWSFPSKATALKYPIFREPRMLDHLRLQVPLYFDFVTRVTYLMEMTPEACKANYCNQNDKLAWYPVSELAKLSLLGPEPGMKETFDAEQPIREIMAVDAILYPMDGQESPKGELLRSCGATDEELLQIYGDFLQHTFPAEFMSLFSFKSYLEKSTLSMSPNVEALFHAFAFNGKSYLDFTEFILGLVVVGVFSGTNSEAPSTTDSTMGGGGPSAVAPRSPTHASKIAKFKAEWLFRYYGKASDGLTEKELATAVAELKIPKTELSKGKNAKGGIDKASFIGLMAKRLGPSNTCLDGGNPVIFAESSFSPIAHLRANQAYPALSRQQHSHRREDAIKAKHMAAILCENCQRKKYHLATHLTKISAEGDFYGPTRTRQADSKAIPKLLRSLSEDFVRKDFICNELLESIRQFAAKVHSMKITKADVFDWSSPKEREAFVPKILKICKVATRTFAKGPRVVKVTSPSYVIGDIHGNLRDLMIYEKNLWHSGIYHSTTNLTFLGDYVDRGEHSVECTLYLLCMKLIAPDHVTMLRGNHETRSLQTDFTFLAEVNEKFGKLSKVIFDAFNSVFDVLPLVAIIDESIYCAHGGVPSCVNKIKQIAAIPCPLVDPDDVPLANEILWNDPITDREYLDLLANKDVAANPANSGVQRGFLSNTKRGTAFYYSNSALEHFLDGNGLSHLIRAHECIPPGYQFHAGGRCITVFSSSNYCAGINESAVALVFDSKIRVIQVETPRLPQT